MHVLRFHIWDTVDFSGLSKTQKCTSFECDKNEEIELKYFKNVLFARTPKKKKRTTRKMKSFFHDGSIKILFIIFHNFQQAHL